MLPITLRALEPEDADLLYVWENDPGTWLSGSRRWPISLADIKALIDHSDLDIWQTRQTRFMIDREGSRETVGCVDLFDFDPLNMHCAVGVLIKPSARRQGFARQAVERVCEFAAETLCVRSVLATVAADNVASLALFRSAGFSQVGRLSGWVRCGNRYVDEVLFQKLLP